jgi:uncharacterized tellurite resistance protein B-like protein
MLENLRKLLAKLQTDIPDSSTREQRDRLLPEVAAALMIEIARADFETDPGELELVERLVAERFDLDQPAVAALLEKAHKRVADAVSLHEFTHALNYTLTEREKYEMVEMLWRVAQADGRVDKHEEHLVRRIADLLHLPHREFIRARMASELPCQGE